MNKEYRKLSELKVWDKNPRTISKEAFERLKWQLEKLGEYKPLLVNQDNIVLGGNMRLKAYTEMGKDKLWVSPVVTKNEAEMWEYALSDNDHVGVTDIELVINAMPQLDIDWAKYSVDTKPAENLQDLIDSFKEIEEDEVPEVPTEAISKLGEVYQLGRHRLTCGDATRIEDVEKLMNGMKADLVITDPPYNTGMDKKAEATRLPHMFQDNLTPEQWQLLINESLVNMEVVTKGECAFYIFIDWRNVGKLKEEMEQTLKISNIIVWDKIVHGLGSDYKFTYEMIVVGKKGQPKIKNRIGIKTTLESNLRPKSSPFL